MDENQTVNQSPEYVADFSWDFAGAKGAVHMDGDVDSLRTLTIDASGANPENAMAVRVEFKGDLFLQLAAGMAKMFDVMGPALAKSVAKAASDLGAAADDISMRKATIKPSDAPAPEPEDVTPSDDVAPQADTATYDGPTPSAQEAASEED